MEKNQCKDLKDLWHSDKEQLWLKALDVYAKKVAEEDLKFEKDEERIEKVKSGEDDFYGFLEDYYKWKYRRNHLISRLNDLKKHESEKGKEELNKIKERIFKLYNYDPADTWALLCVTTQINGLGIAGASGLLAILFPDYYGTLDKYIIEELSKIDLFSKEVSETVSKAGIKPIDAVALEEILRNKAKELNEKSSFNNKNWTPKKIDMILWAYHTCSPEDWNHYVFESV